MLSLSVLLNRRYQLITLLIRGLHETGCRLYLRDGSAVTRAMRRDALVIACMVTSAVGLLHRSAVRRSRAAPYKPVAAAAHRGNSPMPCSV